MYKEVHSALRTCSRLVYEPNPLIWDRLYLLGLNTHVHLLLDFINAVLEDSGLPVLSEVQIMNPFNLKQYVNDKESILDVKAKDSSGKQFNLEV